MKTILQGHGYQAAEAADGKQALAQLPTKPIDLIVSDISMPVMDGFRLCREIKEDEKLSLIPFVFYTAKDNDEKDKEFVLKLGADEYLRRPMEPTEFMKIIGRVMDKAEKGELTPKRPVSKDEDEVCNLNRLEQKMIALEGEIIARQEVEKALRESETRFRGSVDQATDAIFVVRPEGKLVDVNQTAGRYSGYSTEELLTLSVSDISSMDRSAAPETWSKLQFGKTLTIEDKLLRKDGATLPVELHIGLIEVVDNKRCVPVMARDITARKQADEERELLIALLIRPLRESSLQIPTVASNMLTRLSKE